MPKPKTDVVVSLPRVNNIREMVLHDAEKSLELYVRNFI
jgi:hypothetical protein